MHKHHPGRTASYFLHRGGEVEIIVGCSGTECEALTMNMSTWYESLGALMVARRLSDQDVLLAELNALSAYWEVYLLLSDGNSEVAVPFIRARQCGEETDQWDVEVIADGSPINGQNSWSPFGLVRSTHAPNLTQNLWQLLRLVPQEAVKLIGPESLRRGFEHWRALDRPYRRRPHRHMRPSSAAA